MLDLGGERQLDRALAPREQVGEAPVGDDDVGERVRRERDVGDASAVGRLGSVSSSTPIASPRLVTGAYTHRRPSTSTVWPASARPCGVPPAARARPSRGPGRARGRRCRRGRGGSARGRRSPRSGRRRRSRRAPARGARRRRRRRPRAARPQRLRAVRRGSVSSLRPTYPLKRKTSATSAATSGPGGSKGVDRRRAALEAPGALDAPVREHGRAQDAAAGRGRRGRARGGTVSARSRWPSRMPSKAGSRRTAGGAGLEPGRDPGAPAEHLDLLELRRDRGEGGARVAHRQARPGREVLGPGRRMGAGVAAGELGQRRLAVRERAGRGRASRRSARRSARAPRQAGLDHVARGRGAHHEVDRAPAGRRRAGGRRRGRARRSRGGCAARPRPRRARRPSPRGRCPSARGGGARAPAPTGPSSATSQRASSAATRCSVPRMHQIRATERSSKRARSTAAAVAPAQPRAHAEAPPPARPAPAIRRPDAPLRRLLRPSPALARRAAGRRSGVLAQGRKEGCEARRNDPA